MKKNRNHNRINRITTVDGIQYRLNRVIEKTAEDIHHIIGKRHRMEYKTEAPENKIKINRIRHVNLNNFFGDRQSPHEQLAYMLEIRKPVLQPGVRRVLYEILNMPKDMFYIPEVMRGKK